MDRGSGKAHRILALNTLAFAVCFASWMLNGVLVTFLVDNSVFNWSAVQIGWLLGIPVFTGAIFRLPVGILTDRYGGRLVFGLLLLTSAVPLLFLAGARNYATFALCSFGFGLTGASFAVGVAYTSVWYPKEQQGMALGIFGAGNAGAAATTLFAPTLLSRLTDHGANLEGWRTLPQLYAAALLCTGVLFVLLTETRLPVELGSKSLKQLLRPLRQMRVWRFGLYYFLVFGCFVAFSQWLLQYYVSVYHMSLVAAGVLAACFSLPTGVIRVLGGWISDRCGARAVMVWVLGSSVVLSLMLTVPRMEVFSPGRGVLAAKGGVVTRVSPAVIVVGTKEYPLVPRTGTAGETRDDAVLVWPTRDTWQEPAVKVGDPVQKRSLLARGVTRIYFQANEWIFTVLVFLIGAAWGIGMAAVYKFIPDYFPTEVGVVGGMVGVLGGLGGFFCPVIFGYLLEWTGLWTSCWMFMFALSAASLVWMLSTVSTVMRERVPGLMRDIEARRVLCPQHGVEVEIEVSTAGGAALLQRCSLLNEQGPLPGPPPCSAACLDSRDGGPPA